MNYTLNKATQPGQKTSAIDAFKKLWPLVAEEQKILLFAGIAIGINSILTLLAPFVIGYTIDTYIQHGNYSGVLLMSGLLLGMYLVILLAAYVQTKLMGGVGQRVLFRLRNAVFIKLQELPVAFFNQNKAGDLISRINNDTDKLNQFFSQSLMQFIGSVFVMIGAGVLLVALKPSLGAASLLPALAVILFTQATSAWVKRKNAASMKALGGMSSEIQESLNNFKVIIAFDRRDYFRARFAETNLENYKTSVEAGIANNIFTPVYQLAASIAQLIVLTYGVVLIASGNFTVGLLISFLAYVNNFYNPLRQIAALWANYQVALAGWDRIAEILALESDLKTVEGAESDKQGTSALLEFQDVAFRYPDGKEVLHDINFTLERGKTYALVGPTGGGKTTTASLMARLYDPTSGTIVLDGKDIRAWSAEERTKKIGFILQEPFLFSGTVRDNILYGNDGVSTHSKEEIESQLKSMGLESLLVRFEKGLDTPVTGSGDQLSLGQRQLIAFIRAMLRHPDILILDEATANIDTVTEQLLEDILKSLPTQTTRVVIAHRLNTIENADEIFFVNGGTVTRAGSLQHAVDMLLHGKRES
jgi:ATP-binding cassette subfamily B protein